MLYANASCATGECCDLKVHDQIISAVIRHGSCIFLTLKLQLGGEKEVDNRRFCRVVYNYK
jgi:hypothetical protein